MEGLWSRKKGKENTRFPSGESVCSGCERLWQPRGPLCFINEPVLSSQCILTSLRISVPRNPLWGTLLCYKNYWKEVRYIPKSLAACLLSSQSESTADPAHSCRQTRAGDTPTSTAWGPGAQHLGSAKTSRDPQCWQGLPDTPWTKMHQVPNIQELSKIHSQIHFDGYIINLKKHLALNSVTNSLHLITL